MFGPRPRHFHRLHRLDRLHRLGHIASPLALFADDFAGAGRWQHRFRRPRRQGPSMLRLLLAGLAVLAFARVMSSAQMRQRSTVERWIIGGVLVALGAILLSFRRSGRRYGW